MRENGIRKKELLRFLVGGGSAVAVDFFTYKAFMMAGVDRTLAKGLSFILGSCVGFVINKFWTFESKSFSSGEILRYVILYSSTAVINAGVNKVVIALFSIELLGFFCATGTSTVLNFLGQKFFVFRRWGNNNDGFHRDSLL